MKKILAMLLALTLIFTLAACQKDPATDPDDGPEVGGSAGTDDPGQSDDGTEADDSNPGGDDPVDPIPPKVQGYYEIPSGEAALAAAGLLDTEYYSLFDSSAISLTAAARQPVMFKEGTLDAAIVSTQDALKIYNDTDGAVELAAVTTAGSLQLVEVGDTVHTIYDLAGKTVYVAADDTIRYRSGDAKIFEYILTEYGFDIGDGIFLEYVGINEFMEKVDAGEATLGILPASDAVKVTTSIPGARIAISLADEWENVTGRTLLPDSCVIVRKGADAEFIGHFLTDLRDSAEHVADNIPAALEHHLVSSEAEAAAILDVCDYLWLDGADNLREALDLYLEVMYGLDPAAIGGSLPDDGFYR